MTLDRPDLLVLALLAPLELGLILFRTPRIEASLGELVGPARAASARSLHRSASIYGAVFSLLFVLSAVLALAGPAWGSRAVSAERSGLEVSLVLDVSRSMMVSEGGTTRLDQARETIRGLLRVAPEASFALVVTKGASILLVPMTDDLEAVDSGLDYADPDSLSAVGTNLEGGIRAGLEAFSSKTGANRLLVLLSDGGEHGSDSARAAAEARREAVRIIAIGFGGATPLPVPGPSRAPILDGRGAAVRSALQPSALKAVAAATGGRYFEAGDASMRVELQAELFALGKGGKRTEYIVADRTGLFALLALLFLLGRSLASLFAILPPRSDRSLPGPFHRLSPPRPGKEAREGRG